MAAEHTDNGCSHNSMLHLEALPGEQSTISSRPAPNCKSNSSPRPRSWESKVVCPCLDSSREVDCHGGPFCGIPQ